MIQPQNARVYGSQKPIQDRVQLIIIQYHGHLFGAGVVLRQKPGQIGVNPPCVSRRFYDLLHHVDENVPGFLAVIESAGNMDQGSRVVFKVGLEIQQRPLFDLSSQSGDDRHLMLLERLAFRQRLQLPQVHEKVAVEIGVSFFPPARRPMRHHLVGAVSDVGKRHVIQLPLPRQLEPMVQDEHLLFGL